MVVEELFKAKWVEKRPVYSFLLGVFFTIISLFTSMILFRNTPNFIGISTILFTVILIVPTVNKLFDLEEKIEVKKNISFFKKHEHIIDFFIYFFIGVFIVLFVVALISPGIVLSEQQLYSIETKVVQEGRKLPPPPAMGQESELLRIFRNNIYVMIISFVLSLFYGSGALFLITLNASIFASALANAVKSNLTDFGFLFVYSFTLCNLGVLLFHAIPEVGGYLIAAIAGGVLSHAFIREKIGGKNFKIVLKDSVILVLIASLVLFTAAFIETEVSKRLFTSNVCAKSKFLIIFLLASAIIALVIFEYMRKKKAFDK
ncbi:stage II sporulation protein M [Candidatus Woesearchaeota archaeon]|nr:stage II sporulation protein M [Candidatus Woesearchaeota archaeon]